MVHGASASGMRVGRVALVFLCVFVLSPARGRAEDASTDLAGRPLAESRKHLAAGENAEALAKALEALELDPERLDLLDHASVCAEAAGQGDRACFHAFLALAESRAQDCDPVDLDRRAKRVTKLDPLGPGERPDLDRHARRLLAIGTSCIDRRLYANAVEFLHRCRGTASGPAAEEQLERLYGGRRSLEALLETGIDVPVRDSTSRRARRLIRQDPKHEAWDEAWELEGRNYTIVTNVGWELGDAVASAMEQLHPYYREVFLGKRGSGSTRRCTICIYRTLDEFLDHEPGADEETLGFFQPGENRIATYDPRSEGEGLGTLWETLFHEASHQFTDMVTTGTVPAWLNEGTASYFEGADLLPSGRVASNRVPLHYLSDVKAALDEDFPTLRDVISYFEDGSYGAAYYPVGWGLVYFLLNYEDERCERVYAPLYASYMKKHKRGGNHDPFERFEAHFVTKARQPGVEDFAQFQSRFREWINELHALEFGGEEQVEPLLARARRQAERRKWDAARQTYRWASRKSPRHRTVLLELAELLAKRKDRDAAIYWYRRLLEVLAAAGGPEESIPGRKDLTVGALTEQIRSRLVELDPTMVQLQEGAEDELRERVAAAADKYVELGYPRAALLALDGAAQLLGRAPELSRQRRKILTATAEDVWHWRRLPPERGLAPWIPTGDWEATNERLEIDTLHRGTLLLRSAPPARYRLEATIQIREMRSRAFVGLLFGIGDNGILNVWGTDPGGSLEANRIVEDLVRRRRVGKLRGEITDTFRLAVEVDGGRARFFLDGACVGEKFQEPDDVQGRVGLMGQKSAVRFTDVRLGT